MEALLSQPHLNPLQQVRTCIVLFLFIGKYGSSKGVVLLDHGGVEISNRHSSFL